MKTKRSVNNVIRAKLRRIRKQKGLRLAQVASRAGMPLSSYACMEAGHYRISLDNLSCMLRALETDIGAVWPSESLVIERESSEAHN